jgi:hypothetical protein
VVLAGVKYTFLKGDLMKLFGIALMFVAVAGFAQAIVAAPEIDPGSAGSALALLSGALLVIRGGRKK